MSLPKLWNDTQIIRISLAIQKLKINQMNYFKWNNAYRMHCSAAHSWSRWMKLLKWRKKKQLSLTATQYLDLPYTGNEIFSYSMLYSLPYLTKKKHIIAHLTEFIKNYLSINLTSLWYLSIKVCHKQWSNTISQFTDAIKFLKPFSQQILINSTNCLTCDFERIVGWYFRRIFRGQHTQSILTNALQ